MYNHITYDWEFIDDGITIDPISIGMKRKSDGATLYAVNRQLKEDQVFTNPWLVENVWPHLPLISCEMKHADKRGICWTQGKGHLDRDHPACRPLKQIGRMIQDFILETPNPLLWAYYAAYDHVTLAQLWGPMVKLPPGIPKHTLDIKQEMVRLGVESNVLPVHPSTEHNALADAEYNMVMLESLFQLQGGDPYNPETIEVNL